MKIGAVYPQAELGGDPEALHDIAVGVERLGYDHLLLYDHVVGASHAGREPALPVHYNENTPFHEPLVAFGYLAAVTRRIELITGILILPQRQTVLVAKQAAEVDRLSGGRLRLGVATGWNWVEYEALGESFAGRGARLDEQIPYLRRLWSESVISAEGRFDRIDRAGICPRPQRMIPIWCGGYAAPALRRAALLADGFIFNLGLDLAQLDGWRRLQAMLREAGRPIAGFGCHFMMQADRDETFDLEAVADVLPRIRDAGATDASVVTMDRGFATVDQHLDFLADAKARADASLR
jgi:probable F420-dependent oxidoreductase